MSAGNVHREDYQGPAALAAEGVFGLDATGKLSFPRIGLDLLLVLNRIVRHRGDMALIPRIRGIYYEVRPDLPCCLIGKDVWDEIRKAYCAGAMGFAGGSSSLPTYGDLLRGPQKVSWNGILLVCHGCAFDAPLTLEQSRRFDWGRTIPLVRFGVSEGLDRQTCCLGYEFLSNGVVCRQHERTYFFPAQIDLEIWADFTKSRKCFLRRDSQGLAPLA